MGLSHLTSEGPCGKSLYSQGLGLLMWAMDSMVAVPCPSYLVGLWGDLMT